MCARVRLYALVYVFDGGPLCVCVCVGVRERERECVCVWVCVRAALCCVHFAVLRMCVKGVSVCEYLCVYACGGCVRLCVSVSLGVCMCVCVRMV